MAETLGSLCDKLTIVDLKIWHSADADRLKSLRSQKSALQQEINDLVAGAFVGNIPVSRLAFAANKVYKRRGNKVPPVIGGLGEVFSQLATTNCALWHEQEKVYEFEKVPDGEKAAVVKKLAILNLQRNKCMEQLDRILVSAVKKVSSRIR